MDSHTNRYVDNEALGYLRLRAIQLRWIGIKNEKMGGGESRRFSPSYFVSGIYYDYPSLIVSWL